MAAIKIGIIGCGAHAVENLIPVLWQHPLAEVVAICDVNAEHLKDAAALFSSARRYEDFEKLIASGVDAVVAAAPPQVHQRVAAAALDCGVHVFVEKPPVIATADLVALAEKANSMKLVTMVGHNLRHANASLAMKKMTDDPAFGTARSMEVRYFASKPKGDRWGLQSPLRSFLLSHVNHAIDFMCFHVGSVSSIDASAELSSNGSITLAAKLNLISGGVGCLFASSNAPHFSVQATVIGDGDALVAMESMNHVTEFGLRGDPKRTGRCWIEQQLSSGFSHAGYGTELDCFLRAIMGDGNAHPSFTDEVDVYRVLDEIEKAIRRVE